MNGDLSTDEKRALELRHQQAIKLVTTREIDPYEALLLVVAPSPAVHEASLAKVREKECCGQACSRCLRREAVAS